MKEYIIYTKYMKANIEYMGGIKVGDWEGLKKYLNSALNRCGCELDMDRRDEIELFLIEKFWLADKNIPTQVGKKKDPAVKWALREKLQDACFQSCIISTVKDDSGEEVDIFEIVGKEESRYAEIEKWHDIAVTIGAEPARALLFLLYESHNEKKQKQKQQEIEWEWKCRQGVLF